jgi:tubulin polyglutamylase complex subunit 2
MKEREAYQELRQAVTRYAEANSSIEDFTWVERSGVSASEVSAWERKHGLMIPDDMREFFLLWDGVVCRWDVNAYGREVVRLGSMCINSLSQVAPVDASCLCDERDELRPELPTAATSAGLCVFDLDDMCDNGRVLLLLGVVGTPRRAEVWFQDVSCGLTRLASSFADYFRMLALENDHFPLSTSLGGAGEGEGPLWLVKRIEKRFERTIFKRP